MRNPGYDSDGFVEIFYTLIFKIFLIGKNFHETVWLVPRKFPKLKNTGQVPMIFVWKKIPQSRLSRTPEIGFLTNVWKKFPKFANGGLQV